MHRAHAQANTTPQSLTWHINMSQSSSTALLIFARNAVKSGLLFNLSGKSEALRFAGLVANISPSVDVKLTLLGSGFEFNLWLEDCRFDYESTSTEHGEMQRFTVITPVGEVVTLSRLEPL